MNLAIPSHTTANLQPSPLYLSQQQTLNALIMSMFAYCIQRMINGMLQPQDNPSKEDQPPIVPNPMPSGPASNPPYSTNLDGQHDSGTGDGSCYNKNKGGKWDPDADSDSPPTRPAQPTTLSSHGEPPNGTQAPLPSGKVVSAPPGVQNKTIVVHKGEVFDGKNQTYIGGPGLGDGSQNEHQQPLFVVEEGGSLCNVRMRGGGDGVHFMGSGKMVNCVNEDVSEDAVTIDGLGNRAHDAGIAGCNADVSGRPKVEIINCTFNNASDKVVQDNGTADVLMSGDTVNGAGKVFRTNGGYRDIDTHLRVQDCEFNHVKEAVFRTDAPDATVVLANLETDAPNEVIAPNASQANGATRVGHKTYSG
ncbi:pectate lyase [Xanthomonas campestris pv. heliotropii]|nr:pectate lyase [Xanthomonas campestris pv. heliotropii]